MSRHPDDNSYSNDHMRNRPHFHNGPNRNDWRDERDHGPRNQSYHRYDGPNNHPRDSRRNDYGWDNRFNSGYQDERSYEPRYRSERNFHSHDHERIIDNRNQFPKYDSGPYSRPSSRPYYDKYPLSRHPSGPTQFYSTRGPPNSNESYYSHNRYDTQYNQQIQRPHSNSQFFQDSNFSYNDHNYNRNYYSNFDKSIQPSSNFAFQPHNPMNVMKEESVALPKENEQPIQHIEPNPPAPQKSEELRVENDEPPKFQNNNSTSTPPPKKGRPPKNPKYINQAQTPKLEQQISSNQSQQSEQPTTLSKPNNEIENVNKEKQIDVKEEKNDYKLKEEEEAKETKKSKGHEKVENDSKITTKKNTTHSETRIMPPSQKVEIADDIPKFNMDDFSLEVSELEKERMILDCEKIEEEYSNYPLLIFTKQVITVSHDILTSIKQVANVIANAGDFCVGSHDIEIMKAEEMRREFNKLYNRQMELKNDQNNFESLLMYRQ